jgi:hypothetical protein
MHRGTSVQDMPMPGAKCKCEEEEEAEAQCLQQHLGNRNLDIDIASWLLLSLLSPAVYTLRSILVQQSQDCGLGRGEH